MHSYKVKQLILERQTIQAGWASALKHLTRIDMDPQVAIDPFDSGRDIFVARNLLQVRLYRDDVKAVHY